MSVNGHDCGCGATCTCDEEPQAITALQRLEHTQNEVIAAIAELHDYLTGVTRPPERRVVRFDGSKPQLRALDQDGRVAPSVGFWNPNAFSVWAAIGQEIPDGTASGAIEIPNRSFMVIPAAVQDIELGVKAADIAAGQALIHVFRYWSVQPAFLGAR
jgi:hypothetical protein